MKLLRAAAGWVFWETRFPIPGWLAPYWLGFGIGRMPHRVKS